MRLISAIVFFLTIAAFDAAAQTPAHSMINAGILNPRAVTMPTPEYPESAREARHGGIVVVNVVVDESGLIISAVADPYDQHTGQNAKPTEAERRLDPTLTEAAENAARQATFKPFFQKGVPVKFAGKLTYNFIADNSNLPPRVGEIYGPLLNSKAVSLPQPEWPAEAAIIKVPVSVVVHITVDETGKVVSATTIAGPNPLRRAAEAAALKAEFKPYLFMNEPVQIRGVIQYEYPSSTKIAQP